jgi:DnaJ-class molecular chaperone
MRWRRCFSSSGKKTHYQILKVPTNSTLKEIKSQYFKLCLQHHPDASANKGSDSVEEFHQILVAYDTLKDSKKRREYDRTLALTKYQKSGQISTFYKGSSWSDNSVVNYNSNKFWTAMAERRRNAESEKKSGEHNNNADFKTNLQDLKIFKDRILVLAAVLIGYFLSNFK